MTELRRRILEPAAGIRSRNAGLFLWQLDDQSRQLMEDTRGATPAQLGWQPAPGANTIRMLLAHIALRAASRIDRALHRLDHLAPRARPLDRASTGQPPRERPPQ